MDIEYALIADHAEITGGKLYLMGGGWDLYRVAEFPAQVRLAVALGVRIGWEETNAARAVTVSIDHEDGERVANVDGHVTVGRPPHLAAGASQLAQVAVNFQLEVKLPGGYVVRVRAGEADAAVSQALPFRVVKA
ncbi:MAG: hypothetical protein WEC33_00305 [Dehalococcoidia bacterium]